MAPRMPVILNFTRQTPRPPRQRFYIDLMSGQRVLLDLPGVLSLSYGGLPAGPCRLSVYRRGPADYTLEQARVCEHPADLARDGGDLRVEMLIVDDVR